jgi:hypothetical protein
VPIEQLPGHHAAELLDLVDVAIDGLLEDFVDDLEVPGEVCSLEAPREVNKDVEGGDEDDRPLLGPGDFYQFLDVLDADPGEVDADIRDGGLDVRQVPACFRLNRIANSSIAPEDNVRGIFFIKYLSALLSYLEHCL